MAWRPRGDSGATMVEYSIMVGLVALVAFGAVSAFGVSVTGLFQSMVNVF